MARFTTDHYAHLSPASRQHLLDRVVERVTAHPERFPCETEAEARTTIEAELAREVAYLVREDDTMDFLPAPSGYEVSRCRCGAVVWANDATLSQRNPLTLMPHACDGVSSDLTDEERAARQRRATQQRTAGQQHLRATRRPRLIGLGRA